MCVCCHRCHLVQMAFDSLFFQAKTKGRRRRSSRLSSKTFMINIVTASNNKIGHILVQLIHRQDIINEEGVDYYLSMDERSDEMMRLGYLLQNKNGRLRRSVQNAGTGAWHADELAEDKNITYIEEIVITEAWRGRGICTWALNALFRLDVMCRPRFLWAWPTLLNHLEPAPTAGHGKMTAAEVAAYHQRKDRVVNLFRKIGFRRVGNSEFFCMSRDPHHRSRAVAVEGDAPYKDGSPAESVNSMMHSIIGHGIYQTW
ncbi:hypothetical protein FA95DRAFT_1684286 [Auriscalpium vulgare]|uniref:Uncharacterized protein n=1 Tax=Auriscalpium vulgare TaxID=40419 RepID=A0ACB8R698_9AGAM|nr:hypothetical protein FA95DRAFT_1684286 [Auriscalpium vulgare]